MKWSDIGGFLKDNGGKAAGLVGSLVSGNVPGAIAAGVAMIKSATGKDTAQGAAEVLQHDPDALLELERIAKENEADIRRHLEAMTALELADNQASHQQTQETIREGDKSSKWWVSFTRPGQSWASLIAAFFYVFNADTVDVLVLSALLALPFSYAGLRQLDKGIGSGKLLGKLSANGTD